jgi:cellulose synthase/poly-beta-1,6-N-acetylglucosamine synthase-like glycosyltransferase
MLSVLHIWGIYNIPILVVGVKRLRKASKERFSASSTTEELPTFSIIVPAKDEEQVIGRLLDSLLKLDYPEKKREVIIVEDGSSDRTPEICAQYAKLHSNQIRLVRQPLSNGKPSALNCALKYTTGEIVGVLDADNVPERDMLLQAAKYFENSSISAVQGRTCSINSNENMLSGFISFEQTVLYETYVRGKDALNLYVPLNGSCYFVRRSVINEVNGWDEWCLSEDVEMAAKLTEKGYTIKYASDVRSWQENPANLVQFFKQRTRWFRGSMEVSLKYGKLLRNPTKKAFDAEMTLAGPFLFVPCMFGYFLSLFSLVFPFSPNLVLTFMAQGLGFLSTFTLLLLGISLICLAKTRRVMDLLWLPFVYAYWMIENFVAFYAFVQIILNRPRKWVKTTKNGTRDSQLNDDLAIKGVFS